MSCKWLQQILITAILIFSNNVMGQSIEYISSEEIVQKYPKSDISRPETEYLSVMKPDQLFLNKFKNNLLLLEIKILKTQFKETPPFTGIAIGNIIDVLEGKYETDQIILYGCNMLYIDKNSDPPKAAGVINPMPWIFPGDHIIARVYIDTGTDTIYGEGLRLISAIFVKANEQNLNERKLYAELIYEINNEIGLQDYSKKVNPYNYIHVVRAEITE